MTRGKLQDPRVETWNNNDPRLPKGDNRPKDANYKALRDSMKNHEQIHPIVMGLLPNNKWELAVGRGRLMAARELDITIEVKIKEFANMAALLAWRLAENMTRSKNEAADYMSIRKMLTAGDHPSYANIAEKMGIPEGEIKRMDRRWCTVPVVLVQGVIAGNLSATTAIEVGKLKSVSQKACLKIYEKDQKLTAAQVMETRQAVARDTVATLTFLAPQALRQVFSRIELESVFAKMKKNNPCFSDMKALLESK